MAVSVRGFADIPDNRRRASESDTLLNPRTLSDAHGRVRPPRELTRVRRPSR